MRRAILICVLLAVCAVGVAAQDAVSLYEVIPSNDNNIPTGYAVEFRLRVQVDTSHEGGLWVYNNGFRMYSPDGAFWDTTYGQYLPEWLPFGDKGISHLDTDGDGADTVIFGGEDSAGGFWVVYDDVAWSITIEIPDDPYLGGKTICIDSVADTMLTWPWSTWVWHTLTESYVPAWDGPHCFKIDCCNHDGIRGDADYNMTINVADPDFLINYLFFSGPPPPCFEEGDLNGAGSINLHDVDILIQYLFFSSPPTPCPQ